MPLFQGAMGARRYRLLQNVEVPVRELLLDQLRNELWREPRSATKGGENAGWVSVHNLCDLDLTAEKCFYNQYFTFALRMDSKRLPSRLFKAMLDLRLKQWMKERNRERVPAQVKKEQKEQLELELFPKQLPSVTAHDICWDLSRNALWFFSNSNKANEHFRALFQKTFGLDLQPLGALRVLAGAPQGEQWVHTLDTIGHADYRPEGV